MFAERLRFLRKKKKLSQVVLAERLGVANGTVAMWELGKREPDMKMCSRIADFFGVSIDYLVGRTDEPTYIATTTFDDGLVLEAESMWDGKATIFAAGWSIVETAAQRCMPPLQLMALANIQDIIVPNAVECPPFGLRRSMMLLCDMSMPLRLKAL